MYDIRSLQKKVSSICNNCGSFSDFDLSSIYTTVIVKLSIDSDCATSVWRTVVITPVPECIPISGHGDLKGNDTVQIHFYYSYTLRIFFHAARFAYHKMKDANQLGASSKLRKKEICEGRLGILEF